MRILDSKYIEHQAFSSTWSEKNGGKITFKNTVPPGYSIHAGMYLNIECDVQLRRRVQTQGAGIGGVYNYNHVLAAARPNALVDADAKLSKVGECAGLAFQQSITEVRLKINKKGVQRYRNRTFLRDYLVSVVGDNVQEINDGYKWYKAGSMPSKIEDKAFIDTRPSNHQAKYASYIAYNNLLPLHVDMIEGVPLTNNYGDMNDYFDELLATREEYPGSNLPAQVDIAVDGGGNITNLPAFNTFIEAMLDAFNQLNAPSGITPLPNPAYGAPGEPQYLAHVNFVAAGNPGANLVIWNTYIEAIHDGLEGQAIPAVDPTHHQNGIIYDNKTIIHGDDDWRNNSQYISDLIQFNQTSRGYNLTNGVVDDAQANSMATYSKMSPLFAPPFTRLGQVHGSIRGDQELQRHSELLPGIKDYEIQLVIPNGRDLPQGWLEVVGVGAAEMDAGSNKKAWRHELRIKRLEISLVVQYTKLSLSPPVPVFYPAIATEIYSTSSQLIPFDAARIPAGTLFELPLMRIGRIPKYLLIAATIARDGRPEYQGGVDGAIVVVAQVGINNPTPVAIYDQVFQTQYLPSGGASIQGVASLKDQLYSEANAPNGKIIELSIERSSGGDVLFKKKLNVPQIYWITKRSVPCREKYPYDANSFIRGRGAILIDTTLCGLKGNFANEVGLFELVIKAKVLNIQKDSKLITLNCTCIYTNYGFHVKSNTFDYIERHG